MPYLFIILFKINLVLVLFAAAYYLILRRLTFYVINRIFLVFGILFSTIYPFIDLTDFFFNQTHVNQEAVAFVPKINQQVTAIVPSDFITAYWQWISLLFYIGVIFMTFRLMIQFISLYKMHRKSAPGSVADYQVRILEEPVSPFSFWQTVYINPSLHKEQELDTILAHEHIHVKQWHSLDIILAELSVVFYWFNPGVWLMKRAVKENLEFITDEKILKKGVDKKAYQYSLLDVGTLSPSVPIVNNFNLSDLKKRIKMMNVKRSSRLTLSRYLFVLPVLLLTTLAFTVSKKDIKQHLKPLQQALVDAKIISGAIPQAKDTVVQAVVRLKKTIPVATTIQADTTNNIIYIMNNMLIKRDSITTTLAKLIDGKDIFVANVAKHIPKGIEQKYSFEYPIDSLAFNNGEVGQVRNIKIGLKINGTRLPDKNQPQSKTDVVTVIGYGIKNKADATEPPKLFLRGFSTRKEADSASFNDPLTFFFNGEKIDEKELKNIKAEDIKNVRVVKDRATKMGEIHIVGKMNVSN